MEVTNTIDIQIAVILLGIGAIIALIAIIKNAENEHRKTK